ncbi:MAG: tRNA 2-thiocytidine biosynthesis protein TtcA [Spirochaetales bacterium]|nr:tRNA 2-thiocytidine biosynthesis protein TtcA [Spirochaetales bacterium]
MNGIDSKNLKRLEIFTKKAGRGINRFGMIGDGDRVLIGVSGGKDSLALCYALSERRKRLPIRYELEGLFIDWREYPVGEEQYEKIRKYCAGLGIPLRRTAAHMFPESFRNRFDCYLCSRNKKRILFNEAQKTGAPIIALGHHMDDIVETTLLNLFFHGTFATMMPVQRFFGGKLKIVRPLCEVKEKEVDRAARILDCPVFSVSCPRKEKNRRNEMKEIVARVHRLNKRVRENVYGAPWRINADYLPTSLREE